VVGCAGGVSLTSRTFYIVITSVETARTRFDPEYTVTGTRCAQSQADLHVDWSEEREGYDLIVFQCPSFKQRGQQHRRCIDVLLAVYCLQSIILLQSEHKLYVDECFNMLNVNYCIII
jgi:hypothetical protein